MSLKLHYKFNESDVTLDSSGNKKHLVNNGNVVSAVDPMYGNVAYFDGGVTSILSLDVGTPEAIQGSGSRSFSYWYNRDDLFPRHLHDNGESDRFTSILNGNQFFVLGDVKTVSVNMDLPLATWTHITITNDETNLSLYVNGILAASDTDNYLNTSQEKFTIGGDLSKSTDNNFKGSLSDFRVYDYALSASKAMELYTNSPNPTLLKTSKNWFLYVAVLVVMIAIGVFLTSNP